MDLELENVLVDKDKKRAQQCEELQRDKHRNLCLVGVEERSENGEPRELVRTIISVALPETEMLMAARRRY